MKTNEDQIRPTAMTLQALIAPVVGILFLFAGVILSLVLSGASFQDRVEINRSQQIATSGLEIVGRDLDRLAIIHARSTQAHANLVRNFDSDWVRGRFGEGLHNSFGAIQVFVFGAQDNALLYHSGGADISPTGDLGILIDATRRLPATPPETGSGFASIDGKAFVVAASVIAPPEITAQGTSGHILVLAQPMDGPFLRRLEEDFLLEGLQFELTRGEERRTGLYLEGVSGEVLGLLRWKPQRPGWNLLTKIILPVIIATLLAGLLLTTFLRSAIRMAQEIRRGAAALAESGEALEHSESKLWAIFDGVADGIVTFDESGAITSANESAGRIFGYELDEIIGHPANMLVSGPADPGVAEGATSPAAMLRADPDAAATDYRELTGRRRDGSRFILDTAISHVGFQSATIAIAIMRDVTERKQAEETLNLLSTGMILVDRDCRLLMANRSASRVLDSGNGLARVSGRIKATMQPYTEQLSDLVDLACGGSGAGEGAEKAVMTIDRGDGVRPLSIMVAPLQLTQPGEGSPVAAIFIRDMEERHTVAPEVLSKLFGLTPAEARVVVELVKGKRPQEISEEIGVSLNTVRNQLKQIFSKTNTGRQSELIALVLSSTAFVSEQVASLEDEEVDGREERLFK